MIAQSLSAVHAVVSLAPRLADEDPNDKLKGVIDDAGPIAGLFVLLLGISIYFLWRSLNKQMKRIDPSLPSGRDDREQAWDRARTAEAIRRGEADAAPAPGPDADAPSGS